MCGRNSLFAPRPVLEERFGAAVFEGYEPRYNVAPGDDVAVVSADEPDRIRRATWGLLPEWTDPDRTGLHNARAETVDERPSFRDAWAERPCLVLSSGFYEWHQAGTHAEPYRIHRQGETAFAMAGIWSPAPSEEDEMTVAVLTTEPNETVRPIHDRMPVVLERESEKAYLQSPPAERQTLCRPYRAGDLEAYEISPRVNDPGVDDPAVIEPASSAQSGLEEFG